MCRLKHRGPDWSGLYQHGDCFLAHQRLAIIDPASGDQPLFNEDKSVVVTVIYQYALLLYKCQNITHPDSRPSDCAISITVHLIESGPTFESTTFIYCGMGYELDFFTDDTIYKIKF